MENKRIKLAYICLRFSPELGGPTYHLLKELSKYIDILCISIGQEYEIEKSKEIEIINPNLKIRRFSYKEFPLKRSILIPKNLPKILDEEKPDIVQSNEFFTFTTIQAGGWAKKNKVPFILNSRMRYRPGLIRNLGLWIFKLLSKKVVNYSNYIIATQGKCSKDEFLRWFPKTKSKIEIIPSGLDINEFTKNKNGYNFRKRYNIPKDKKIILNVARIYPVKRLDLLIRAFAIIKKQCKDVVLVNVGPAERGEKIKLINLIKNLKLEIKKDIIFTGAIENKNLAPAYASADVFVNTSETEGICFSFLEAMSFNLPIVAFNVGGNSGVVEQEKTGFLTKFGDVKGVAKGILRILNDEKLKEKMGRKGHNKLKKEFDIKKNARKLIKVYGEIV